MRRFFQLSHITAGFLAVLVGYTSSAAIVFSAAAAAGGSASDISSWMLALGVGMGATCIGLSLYFRSPILTAWSTPGAALLATSLAGVPMNEAVGAFLLSSLLLTVLGFTGWMEKLLKYLPRSVAMAMLGGVLLKFGLGVFVAASSQLGLIVVMLALYLVAWRLGSRYAVPLAFLGGLVASWATGSLHYQAMGFAWSVPVLTWPSFSLATTLGVGLPLFLVTMASQNVPGIAVLRANGYQTPVSPLIGWTGVTGLVLGPFGGYQFNLAAITAALCMSPEADPDPKRRWGAAVWAGLFYLATGLLGATVVNLFTALPKELVAGIAGIALLGTLGNNLAEALAVERERLAALVTFLVTASGLTLLDLGSAFWGLLVGLVVLALSPRPAR